MSARLSDTEYRIDPERGIVYGMRGKPIRTVSGGYIRVARHAGTHHIYAHRMIWEHVHGSIPEGMQINHINGIKTDNRISNLELVTASENVKHAFRIGLMDARGENNGRAIGKRRRLQREAA